MSVDTKEKSDFFEIKDIDKNKLSFDKILKLNSIIHGRFSDINTTLYANDFKNINFLYRLLENVVRQEKEPPKGAITIRFPLDLFRITMDNQTKWKSYFINSIIRLENTKFELKNYFDEVKKQKIDYQSTRLLVLPKFYTNYNDIVSEIPNIIEIDDETEKRSVVSKGVELFEVTFPNEIAVACWQKRGGSGYTHINMQIVNKFQNKFTIRLYEVLLSKIQFLISKDELPSIITLTKDELSNVFTKRLKKHINLKHFLINNVHFEKSVMPELKEKLPIADYFTNQKDFSLSFSVDINGFINFANNRKSPYEIAMEQFHNLIKAKVHKQEYNTNVDGYKVSGNSSFYELDGNQINVALNNFMLEINDNYYDIELLKTADEKKKFGNVIMVQGVGFVDKDTDKLLSKPNRVKFLRYLYHKYYIEIISNIKNGTIPKQQSTDKFFGRGDEPNLFSTANKPSDGLNLTLRLFIGRIIKFSSTHNARVKSLKKLENGKIEATISIYAINDESKNEIMEQIQTFENTTNLMLYIENNKA